ncbi:MAG: NAD(P)H-quinone oxidoreductase [Alphaproteobacteria bacterium]|nr:NAD(P)H-quinone oxidoreductase [Alphaproteobacteria bacterium]
MQAIQVEGDHLVLRPAPMPVCGTGAVLIRVHAAGVNRADLLQRRGKYPPPADASPVLGMEVAGEVVAVGAQADRWKLGDRVCALLGGGGYATYAVAPAAHCLPVPQGYGWAQAAALPEAIITVYANLFDQTGLKAGDCVLIHGGASGIGTAAIQMLKLTGVDSIVTVGRDEKMQACRDLGARAVINYNTQDFVEAVRAETGGQGVQAVLDMVGGDYVNRNLACLGKGGLHVSIATQRGRVAEVDIGLVMRGQLILTGSTLRARGRVEKARLVALVERDIWPDIIKKHYKPLISNVFDINQADEAHKMMESSAHIGKIILEVG